MSAHDDVEPFDLTFLEDLVENGESATTEAEKVEFATHMFSYLNKYPTIREMFPEEISLIRDQWYEFEPVLHKAVDNGTVSQEAMLTATQLAYEFFNHSS